MRDPWPLALVMALLLTWVVSAIGPPLDQPEDPGELVEFAQVRSILAVLASVEDARAWVQAVTGRRMGQ